MPTRKHDNMTTRKHDNKPDINAIDIRTARAGAMRKGGLKTLIFLI